MTLVAAQPNWVVRGGLSQPEVLKTNYKEHLIVSGLFGFSTQYRPGILIDDLARAGQFPNANITAATYDELIAAVAALGYTGTVTPSPGSGYHATFSVSRGGMVVRSLSDDAAAALSATFQKLVLHNPSRQRP